MKSIIKLLFVFILIAFLFIISGCDTFNINDPANNKNVNPEAEVRLTKKNGKGFNCRGYAVWDTGLPSYDDKSIGSIPTSIFTKTNDSTEAIICEWASYHAARITNMDGSGTITVNEYAAGLTPHEQRGNEYESPYDHELAPCGITAWWKKDPPSLAVEINGPSSLPPGENGTFTAKPSGGCLEYKNYRWWKRNDGDKGGKGGPKAPPVGEWFELEELEGYKKIVQTATYNFSLKCEVTDYWGAKATDVHSVTLN